MEDRNNSAQSPRGLSGSGEQDPQKTGEALRWQLRKRGIITRLWESYAYDLLADLRLLEAGRITQHEVDGAFDLITPIMKSLRPGGPLSAALEKSQMVILDRLMGDIDDPAA